MGLGAISEPTDNGMRCTRSAAGASCQLSRTTFLGIAGNTAFSIPESGIRSSEVECAKGGVGINGGSNCAVYLTLDAGGRRIVSSYALRSEAGFAARRIGDYLRDPATTGLVVDEDTLTPVLM